MAAAGPRAAINRSQIMDVWKTEDDGDTKLALLTTWRQVGYGIDPEETRLNCASTLVAALDDMYDDMTGEQKADWTAQKTDVEAAVTDVCNILRCVMPDGCG